MPTGLSGVFSIFKTVFQGMYAPPACSKKPVLNCDKLTERQTDKVEVIPVPACYCRLHKNNFMEFYSVVQSRKITSVSLLRYTVKHS